MPSDLGRECGVIADRSSSQDGMLLGLVLACLIPSPERTSASEGPPRARTFELTYQATVRDIPDGAKALDLWLPLPQTDRNQTIHRVTIDAPSPVSIGREARFGNQCLHVRVGRPKAPVTVTLVIEATRRENAGSRRAPERRGAGRVPQARAAGPPGRPRPGARPGGDPWPDDRRREGPGDLREGRGHDEVRQERAPAGAGGTPCSPAMRGGATAPTSTPWSSACAARSASRPGSPSGCRCRRPEGRARSPATTAGPSCTSRAGAGCRWTPARRRRTRRGGATSSGTTTRTGWSSAGAGT